MPAPSAAPLACEPIWINEPFRHYPPCPTVEHVPFIPDIIPGLIWFVIVVVLMVTFVLFFTHVVLWSLGD